MTQHHKNILREQAQRVFTKEASPYMYDSLRQAFYFGAEAFEKLLNSDPNVQVSDTTGDASSNADGTKQ